MIVHYAIDALGTLLRVAQPRILAPAGAGSLLAQDPREFTKRGIGDCFRRDRLGWRYAFFPPCNAQQDVALAQPVADEFPVCVSLRAAVQSPDMRFAVLEQSERLSR